MAGSIWVELASAAVDAGLGTAGVSRSGSAWTCSHWREMWDLLAAAASARAGLSWAKETHLWGLTHEFSHEYYCFTMEIKNE